MAWSMNEQQYVEEQLKLKKERLAEVPAKVTTSADKPDREPPKKDNTFSDKGKAVTSGLASILGTALKARKASAFKGDTPDRPQPGGKQDDSYSSVVTYETNQTTRLRDDKKKKKDEY
tara:strand:+ start:424 stop:777 length:354 start_codon:yes stop_codon:yes gene_type:complete